MPNINKIKNQVIDSYENKNKLRFYAYEFFGTALMIFAVNMGSVSSPGQGTDWFLDWKNMYVVALWICWEPSCAHFNSAISFATLLYKIGWNCKAVGEHFTTFFILFVV